MKNVQKNFIHSLKNHSGYRDEIINIIFLSEIYSKPIWRWESDKLGKEDYGR